MEMVEKTLQKSLSLAEQEINIETQTKTVISARKKFLKESTELKKLVENYKFCREDSRNS